MFGIPASNAMFKSGVTPTTNKCFQTDYGPFPRTQFQDYFTAYSVGTPTSNYSYYSVNSLGNADDGVVTYDSVNRILDINSGVGSGGFTRVWTSTIPEQLGSLDHMKYVVLRKEPTVLPSNGDEIVWEVCAALEQQVGTIPVSMLPGVTNPRSDPRIASGVVTCIDPSTWMVFSFYITDETVYVGYERLPFNTILFGGTHNYKAFSHLIPVSKRVSTNPSINFDVYAIGFNKKEGRVRYFINGVEVYRVQNIGMPIDRNSRTVDYDGNEEVVSLDSVYTGFGTETLLDHINPVKEVESYEPLSASAASGSVATSINPLRPLVELGLPTPYLDPVRTRTSTGTPVYVGDSPSGGADTFDFLVTSDATTSSRLFGNGAHLRLKWVHTHLIPH